MRIANSQSPIANYGWATAARSRSIGNWQLAIGNCLPGPLPYGRGTDRAFSLVEMMIAIVILGLGMIMVATMFPVAWDRARDLSEFTIEQTAVGAAQAALEAVVKPAGASFVPADRIVPSDALFPPPPRTVPPFDERCLSAGSFAGDMFFDPLLATQMLATALIDAFRGIVVYSDTRVHVLHMENILGSDPTKAVEEEPWQLERMPDFSGGTHPLDSSLPVYLERDFVGRTSFYAPQVRIAQRVQPALDSRPEAPAAVQDRDRWNEKLASRRFCWAALHRLRGIVDSSGQLVPPVGPPCETQDSPLCLMSRIVQLCGPRDVPSPPLALTPRESQCIASLGFQSLGASRTFDMYYVTLRRPQPTHRYARQNPNPQNLPDPYVLDAPVASPAALPVDQDVLLPVAWRVQIQLPPSLPYRAAPPTNPQWLPTGVPTEITVPPAGVTGQPAAMLVSMFPQGTRFVDELNGQVYRATKRRLNAAGDQATLTLDREIVLEDVELPPNDLRCGSCNPINPTNPQADAAELLRTVLVFPPPVDRSTDPTKPLFDGPSPVVGIEVRTLSVSPGS